MLAYHGDELVLNTQIFNWMFWTFGLHRRAFEYCKLLVYVDGTYLYGSYKGTLLVAAAQDGNKTILLIVFAIIKGEIANLWPFFFLSSM